ncbi:LANO_0A03774g1_1 [Lachancea nothofagi CBS 11611]|uniref:Very long-chain fatty acid transport protein n=1 Tax=Lachancea nothofagi CBS 11611 TaxID=1266666 RepID=A0A1G4IPU7_9SACH|nr:LANO_0A03774g1_1 [Lachancea nothofagi CBS 11611]
MTGSEISFVALRVLKLVVRVLALPFILLSNLLTLICGGWFAKLDERHRIRDDWYIATYFLVAVPRYIWSVYRGKFQFWYTFKQQVNRNGDLPCISYPRPLDQKGEFEMETFTYRETYDIVLRLSFLLYHEYGVREGHTVAMDYANKPMFIFMWFALWNIGAVPSFLNYNSIGVPLVHSIKIANVRAVFVDLQVAENIKATEKEIRKELPQVKVNYLSEEKVCKIIVDKESPQFLQDAGKRSPPFATDFQPACLIYTSGTTGLPKSAIMSWRKAVIGCSLFGYIMRIKKGSTVFTAMPLYHSTAALLGVCAVFSQGGCVAISNKFSASSFWKQAYLTKSTHVQYVGEICRYLLHTRVSEYESMHCVKVAYGNGLRADIWQEFRNRFGIQVIGEFYASTEAPFATTTFQRGDFGVGACRCYGTVINKILSIQQTIVRVDPEDESTVFRNERGFCEVTPPGEPGEMLMKIFMPKKPEATFQGYLGNKKATKSKVLRDVFRKGDAWYRSGDLVKSDELGLWYFVDRMGDTFRWKSENVSATEVEDQIMSFANYLISAVVVVGIKVPDHEGRAGFAVLELAPTARGLRGDVKFLNEMLSNLKKSLPKYALPTFVKFVDEIEHTDNHKIKKKSYKDQVLPHGAGGDEILYWLKNSEEYKPLTNTDWIDIMSGTTKL